MKRRTLIHLAEKLRQKHAELNSWPKTSISCDVLTRAGKPNPRLAQMIAAGYDPRTQEVRNRLGLSPRCAACSRWLPRQPRMLPAWLLVAIQNLAELEKTVSLPEQARVYARSGKRVRIPVRETFVSENRMQNMVTSLPSPVT